MINTIAIKTLYKKEILRFMRVYNQTLIAPIINACLFFIIFSVAMPQEQIKYNYNLFLLSGLTMMSIINSAYNNSVFLVLMKMTGNIVDFVTMPMKPNEIIFSLCTGSITRAILVAFLIYISLSLFIWNFSMHNFLITIFYAFISSLFCSLIGLIGGLLFGNFEESSIITNYIITPLSFLSGTFYSVSKLPIFFQKAIQFNPFFYMIDGFRYGVLGVSEGSLLFGSSFIILLIIILWSYAYWILRSGYKIRK
jgi:ABC-2 type transport system permease protein